MRKKDYELIAGAISQASHLISRLRLDKHTRLATLAGIAQARNTIALALSNDNPKFDIDKFGKLCNLD